MNTQNINKRQFIFMTMLFSLLFFQIQACGGSGTNSTSDTPTEVPATTGPVIQNSRSGTITIQFKNESAASSSRSALHAFDVSSSGDSPTFFGMKLIAAYLAEDIDPDMQNNIGQTLMFYENTDCQNDIMHCDLSGGTAEDGNPMDKIIGTHNYFDLTDPAAANAALNSQTQQVTQGSYQYARLEFCKYNAGNADNIEWEFAGVPKRSFRKNECTVNSAKIVPAVDLPENAAVTFVANYSIIGSITSGSAAQGEDCTTDTDGTRVCFTLPTFTPEIIVQ